MDDIQNQYLNEQKRQTPEEFDREMQAIESGELQEPVSPLDDHVQSVDVVQEEPETKPKGFLGTLKDVGNGAVVGWLNGSTEIVHTLGNIADMITPKALTGGNADYFSEKSKQLAPKLTEDDLGLVGLENPESFAGQTTEAATQFLTGFLPALKGMKVIGGFSKAAPGTSKVATAVKSATGAGAAGAVADFSVFDPYEKRLSNFAKESGVPGFDNMMTQYLAADLDDTELEGRFKQAMEGYFLGKTAEGLFLAARSLKRWKWGVKEEAGALPKSKVSQAATATDPVTGEQVVRNIDEITPAIDEATGQAIDIPTYIPKEGTEAVRILPAEQQKDLANALLDGDLDGAAQHASGQVNLKYIDTEAGINDLIESLAVTREAALPKGTRSWKEAAAKQGTDLETYTARVQGLDTDVAKAEYARNAVGYKVKELANVFKANPSKVTKTEFQDAFKKLNVIDTMVSRNKTEIARALAIMRRSEGLTNSIDNIKTFAKESVGLDGTTDWDKLAVMIGDMPDTFGVANLVQAYRKPNWADAAVEVWVNNLFALPTLAKNVISTGISIGQSVPERYLGALSSQMSGSKALSIREANTYALGLLKAFPEALRVTGRSYKTEIPQISSTANEFQEIIKTGALSGEAFGIDSASTPLMQNIGKAIDLTGTMLRSVPGGTRSLMATDEGMKALVYRAELSALAQRQALAEGLEPGTEAFARKITEIDFDVAAKNPDSAYYGLELSAMDAAHRRTFTEQLGEKGNNLLEAVREFKPSYAVLPFIKTPVNLVKYMARRTPGLAGFSNHVNAELAAGGARADLVSAQINLGGMVTASSMVAASNGLLQGDISTNWSVNKNLRALGFQPRSIVLEDGKQLSMTGFDGSVVSMALLAATAQETIDAYIEYHRDDLGDDDLVDGILDIMTIPMQAYMKYGVNATWGQGVSQIVNATQDGNWNRYASNMLSNMLPAANTIKYVNQQALEIDPFARELDDAMDAIRAKLPDFSRDIPPRATLLGDPSVIPQYMLQGLVPSFVVTPPEHPVPLELNRLQKLDPTKVVMGGPSVVLGDVALDNVEKWNHSQFLRFQKIDGKDLLETLQEAMESTEYQEATDTTKENILSKVYNARKKFADIALQEDALAFEEGRDRPHAEQYRLYPYKRAQSLTRHIGNKKAVKFRDESGSFEETDDATKEQYIKQYTDEISGSNFIRDTLE